MTRHERFRRDCEKAAEKALKSGKLKGLDFTPTDQPTPRQIREAANGHAITAFTAEATGIRLEEDERRALRIKELEDWRPTLIAYLEKKMSLEDWHGVQDAASDLRDLDCELDGLRY